ncbi:zinc finger protein 226-like [Sabethes cyaneus]|uniref:zinc finger protein 226-like n=1 Tax=Sabethes cyaneus TaxID=53552 RepID=UPI00237DBACF|nr:zinc finger protein 226-like [Sabethes cyaneus]
MISLPKNIENICRLCLTVSDGSDMLPLFPVRGGNPFAPHTVVTKILNCTTVKIEHYEGAPVTICEFCNTRLEDWHAFREQCIGTDEYLKANYQHIFYPNQYSSAVPMHQGEPINDDTAYQHQQQQQQEEELQQEQAYDIDYSPNGDDSQSHLFGEEVTLEDMMQQEDQYYGDDYDVEEQSPEEQPKNHASVQNGIRVPKWSKEFGAKLNTLLHVVGGERAHQCKVCRKRFLRRPHCRRHVAHAHPAEIDDVELPRNWQSTIRRRFVFSTAPVQRVLEPVPPPPPVREDQYEPSPHRPHQCEVCKKCFKRSQHLRRHKTSHLQIEIDRSEIMRGIKEQQKAQEQLEQLTSPATSVNGTIINGEDEDDDVIALSDDEDMGEEISPEEFNGLSDIVGENEDELEEIEESAKSTPKTNDRSALKGPRLSDIPHLYYSSDDSQQALFTKDGTFRQRAPPMPKLPGERPYVCKVCNKTFKRTDHLKSHMRTHSSTTPFNCDWCEKGFRYRQNYMIHMKNKTCVVNVKGKFSGHPMPRLLPKPGMEKVANGGDMVLSN